MRVTDASVLSIRRGATHGPLYAQVSEQLERLVLWMPVEDSSPLPPESQLMEQFGVSRGTIRRAVDFLVRDGLLRIEPGRGTFVNKSAQVRRLVWERLAAVAKPDSRFDYDFKRFVPDFEGRQRCEDRLRGLPVYAEAHQLFIAPDNSLESLRAQALNDGKRIVVPTYGGSRGMFLLDPKVVRKPQRELAATLDGMERFGTHLTLEGLRSLGSIDLLVTGAVATTRTGVHLGSGDAYLDVEWAILRETGLVDRATPVIAVVHGVQVIEDCLEPGPLDCSINVIITPDEVITPDSPEKPGGLDFSRLKLESVQRNEYLRELAGE